MGSGSNASSCKAGSGGSSSHDDGDSSSKVESSGVSSGSPRFSVCSDEANNAIDYDTATLKRRSKIRAEEKAAAR